MLRQAVDLHRPKRGIDCQPEHRCKRLQGLGRTGAFSGVASRHQGVRLTKAVTKETHKRLGPLASHVRQVRTRGRDFDRPLAPRGLKAAARVGAFLADEQLVPDFAYVSPARRARETWDLVRPHLGDVSERSEPRLYEAAADQLLAIVREIGREIGTLLIGPAARVPLGRKPSSPRIRSERRGPP